MYWCIEASAWWSVMSDQNWGMSEWRLISFCVPQQWIWMWCDWGHKLSFICCDVLYLNWKWFVLYRKPFVPHFPRVLQIALPICTGAGNYCDTKWKPKDMSENPFATLVENPPNLGCCEVVSLMLWQFDLCSLDDLCSVSKSRLKNSIIPSNVQPWLNCWLKAGYYDIRYKQCYLKVI